MITITRLYYEKFKLQSIYNSGFFVTLWFGCKTATFLLRARKLYLIYYHNLFEMKHLVLKLGLQATSFPGSVLC